MSVRDDIIEVFTSVAHDHAKRLVPLTDDVLLRESGIDSICLAIVLTNLEARLGSDPFNTLKEIEIPATFGEFVAVYERAVDAAS